MSSNKRASWFIVGFSLLTFMAFVGATTGTLAWYAYSTRASMSYMGTSVAKTEQLQIGLVDDGAEARISSETIATYHYERDTDDIVWAPAGTGFVAEVISEFIINVNKKVYTHDETYANSLSPVSTKNRTLDSKADLTLYNPPMFGYESYTAGAETGSFMELPFAFRIVDNNGQYLEDKSIWITDATAVMKNSSKSISNALRIFSDDPNDSEHNRRFVLNPSATNSGYTLVAGCLDLNSDGYYDTFPGSAGDKADQEIIYGLGSYTGTPTYSDSLTEDSELDDINNTSHSEATTFYAKHKQGMKKITNYSALLETVDKAYYYGVLDARPTPNATTGLFEGGLPITITDTTTKIGFTNLTIFLEGWDHTVIDQEAEYQFNLGLTFEIDRIQL